jgi:hypothetical protein
MNIDPLVVHRASPVTASTAVVTVSTTAAAPLSQIPAISVVALTRPLTGMGPASSTA